ncbi:MAG: hypothetical protein BGP06_20725 [Rhizobiales bacterium 65-9]|nr:AprI/Inh family metalloprotease inhibitor [Hyphomicrobiales bacterium]OJY36456.1 MAG: hypothetical protein BGP06_20725 [Rhizobiales bacterium 65-9]
MPRLSPLLSASLCGLLVSACAGTSRFDGFPGMGAPPPRVAAAPAPEPAPMAIPGTGPVTSEPLPPPAYPGSAPMSGPGGPGSSDALGQPANPQMSGLPPTIPGAPPPGPGAAPAPLNPQMSSVPPPAAPAPPSTSSRLAAVGSWTARDATGATCRVTLSSAAALDLYKASASGCANRDLARVNAWKQEGSEIYLYSAGSVVARLPAGGGAMNGALSRSGAPLTLSR